MERLLHSQAVGENKTADALLLFFYAFTPSFGGMVAQAGQRAKAKYLGFVATTAGRNKPGSRSTSLKTQRESSRAFLALLPLSPSLHFPFCLSLHAQHTPSPNGN